MSTRVKPGDVLGGKYRVERVLGTGGMGVVVAAKHIDLGQRVALKFMLREAMQDPQHAERFLREARSASQLKSVHTARVMDVGRLKNGEPFMVMEYLEGQDLDEVLRTRGPFTGGAAVDTILQACEALAEAHGLGMIHRDVKLKNLFLTTTIDGRALVKILDFGLAKNIGPDTKDVSLTATSAVFGSPQYMSPEQMRSAKDVDVRSDIWSVGVCLYELLTGRVPFDANGLAEICAMVLKDPVEPPSTRSPGIDPALEAIVMRCLEKDPARRFQTIAELAFALEPFTSIEGSARRILNVMTSAQKSELATLRTAHDDFAGPAEGAKTHNAWDSGEQRTRDREKKTTMQIAMAIFGMFAFVGIGAMGLVVLKKQSISTPLIQVTSAAAAAAASAPPEPPADPPSRTNDIGAAPSAPTAPPSAIAAAPTLAGATPTGTATTTSRPGVSHPPVARTGAAAPPPRSTATAAAKPAATNTGDPGSHM